MVNCTGIGAHALCPEDPTGGPFPVQGQIAIVHAPHVRVACYEIDEEVAYIIPSSAKYGGGYVELGGTSVAGAWSRTPDPRVTQGILERCTRMVPALHGAKVVDEYVCLRPKRKDGVRMEVEWRPLRRLLQPQTMMNNTAGPQEGEELEEGPKRFAVVHNYGHGGAGYTLSWGMACEVSALVRKAMAEEAYTSPLLLKDAHNETQQQQQPRHHYRDGADMKSKL